MTNLLNRVGRAAILALMAGAVFALGVFGENLEGLENLTPVGNIIISTIVGLVGLAVEFLRDQWTIQQNQAFRTHTALMSVSIWSRLGRGLLVGAAAFIVTVGAEWAQLIPEITGIWQIVLAGVLTGLNALLEWLRDRFDLPS